MRWREWLENWSITALKISTPFAEAEWASGHKGTDAGWEPHFGFLTRITTRPLARDHDLAKTSIDCVYAILSLTREIIKRCGCGCVEFTKLLHANARCHS